MIPWKSWSPCSNVFSGTTFSFDKLLCLRVHEDCSQSGMTSMIRDTDPFSK